MRVMCGIGLTDSWHGMEGASQGNYRPETSRRERERDVKPSQKSVELNSTSTDMAMIGLHLDLTLSISTCPVVYLTNKRHSGSTEPLSVDTALPRCSPLAAFSCPLAALVQSWDEMSPDWVPG